MKKMILMAMMVSVMLFICGAGEEKRSAEEVCACNLKQIGLALNMFSQDRNKIFPTRR